uniref:Protein argonaute N-terminal domain-containing protein n=1 Tax=Oryza rufipogon TaxID=4529 RepID=A0A0E0P1G3_ORYRU
MTPRPGPPPPQYPQPGPPAVVHGEPMPALHHQASYQPGAVYRAPSPGVPVPLGGYARSTPVTIRAPPPLHSSAPAPYQPAAAPASSSSSSAPSATALAKEVEQKLFVSETALAPPAAAASAAAAPAGEASVASDKDRAPVSKKGLAHPARPGFGAAGKKVMIRANHFLANVADNNLFHYDVSINPESKSRATNREVPNDERTSLGGKLPVFNGTKSLYSTCSLPFESEEFVVANCLSLKRAGRTDLYHFQFLLFSEKQIDCAVFLVWPDQLPYVQEKLMCAYQPPPSTGGSSSPAGSLNGYPISNTVQMHELLRSKHS